MKGMGVLSRAHAGPRPAAAAALGCVSRRAAPRASALQLVYPRGCRYTTDSSPLSFLRTLPPLSSLVRTQNQPSSYLRTEDAKEIEERFLRPITPKGKDPWAYNRHLLPKFQGIRGDHNVVLSELKAPEQLVLSFLQHLTYPSEIGHDVTWDPLPEMDRPLYHWTDERVFGMPPVAVVRLQAVDWEEGSDLIYAEVHWHRRVLRVYQLELENGQDDEVEEMEGIDEVREVVSDPHSFSAPSFSKQVAEYNIPAHWLLEMKKRQWPAPPDPDTLKIPGLFIGEDEENKLEEEVEDDELLMEEEEIYGEEEEDGEEGPAVKPITVEPFAHRQHMLLKRRYSDLSTDQEEEHAIADPLKTDTPEEEDDDADRDDSLDESFERLSEGNVFVSKDL